MIRYRILWPDGAVSESEAPDLTLRYAQQAVDDGHFTAVEILGYTPTRREK